MEKPPKIEKKTTNLKGNYATYASDYIKWSKGFNYAVDQHNQFKEWVVKSLRDILLATIHDHSGMYPSKNKLDQLIKDIEND